MSYEDIMATACSAISAMSPEDSGASVCSVVLCEPRVITENIKVNLKGRILEVYKSMPVAENSIDAHHGHVYRGYYYAHGYLRTGCLYLCVENCAVDFDGWIYCKALIPIPDTDIDVSKIPDYINNTDGLSIKFVDPDLSPSLKETGYAISEDIINKIKELDLGDSIIFDVKPGDEVLVE